MTTTPNDEPALTPEQLAELNKFNNGGAAHAHAHLPIPGLEYLGRGYNVFGRYASADSCRQRIIDFDGQVQIETQIYDESLPLAAWEKSFSTIPAELKMLYQRPKNTAFLGEYKPEWEQEFQSSAEEQVKKWSAKVDVKASYGAFSGEVGARLNSFYSKLTDTKYWSLVGKNTYYTLSIEDTFGQPAPLILGVQSDLDNPKFPPRDFFQKYGTHYLREVTIGSRVTITKSVDTSKVASDFDFAAHLKAAYAGPSLAAAVTADAAYQTKLRQFQKSCKEHIEGAGISDSQLTCLKEGSNTTIEVLKGGWHNPTLIDFRENALVPIWERCTESARKQAFEEEFRKQAAEKGSIFGHLGMYKSIYLYRYDGPPTCYRFYNRGDLVATGWNIENKGEPIFYIAAKALDGTQPLYEYRFKSGLWLWRYETSDWEKWMKESCDDYWYRVSDVPLGYVPTQSGPEICPVYAYEPVNPEGKPRFYYSVDSDDHTREPGEAWMRFVLDYDLLRRVQLEHPEVGHGVPQEKMAKIAERFEEIFNRNSRGQPQWYAWRKGHLEK